VGEAIAGKIKNKWAFVGAWGRIGLMANTRFCPWRYVRVQQNNVLEKHFFIKPLMFYHISITNKFLTVHFSILCIFTSTTSMSTKINFLFFLIFPHEAFETLFVSTFHHFFSWLLEDLNA
jgi:hypothetical protein